MISGRKSRRVPLHRRVRGVRSPRWSAACLFGNYADLKRARVTIKKLKAEKNVTPLTGNLAKVDPNRAGQATDVVDVALAEPDGTPVGGQRNKYNLGTGLPWCAYCVVWCTRGFYPCM